MARYIAIQSGDWSDANIWRKVINTPLTNTGSTANRAVADAYAFTQTFASVIGEKIDGVALLQASCIITGTGALEVELQEWNGSAWVQRGTVLEDPLPEGSSRFGEAVALNGSGTRLIVGAYLKHNGGTNRGTVRRYDWNGSSWASTAVVSPMSQNYMWFGRDVALSSNGNVLFVGAAGFTSWDHASCGGVYVFDWNGSSYVSRSGGDFPSIYGKSQSQRMGSSVATNGTGSVLLNYSSSYCQTYEWDGAKFVMRRELFVALNNRNTVAVDDAAEKLVIGMITTSDYRGGIWTFAPMSIGGLVSMRGVNNVRTLLANRDVRLYNRSTGQLVQSTTTNDIGSYGFNVSSGSYNVVVLDDEAGTVYNDQIRRAVVS